MAASDHLFVVLPPRPGSVGEARRITADQIRAAQDHLGIALSTDLLDNAQLLVSELVTNAVLHARTEIGFSVTIDTDRVKVQVADASSRMPSPRGYDSTASTGKGIALVQALAARWGAHPQGQGKVVWFTLSLVRRADPAAGAADSPSSIAPPASAAPIGSAPAHAVRGTEVALNNLPMALYAAFVQQAEALLREYTLAAYGELDNELEVDRVSGTDNAGRAGVAADALGRLTDAMTAALSPNPQEGGNLDLTVVLDLEHHTGFGTLQAVLAEAVAMADHGELLAPPSQPEIIAVRDWLCAQVQDQPGGRPARAWQPLTAAAAPNRPRPAWDPSLVTGSTQALVAADDANRILAVSRPLSDLLGWWPEDLLGERLVALIPAEQREAHIAGFTRYLTTGEARILGRPVAVEALHRDGHHVAVSLIVHRHPVPGGGQIFIAQLTRPR